MPGRIQTPSPGRRSLIFAYFGASDGRSLTIGLLDPRFVTQFDRLENRLELLPELDAAFAKRERDKWLDLLTAAGVLFGLGHDYEGATSDPQALANGYITTLEHPSLGEVGGVGSPIRMSETPVKPRHTAPEHGQHTEELLLALGYDWDAIASLKDCEVI